MSGASMTEPIAGLDPERIATWMQGPPIGAQPPLTLSTLGQGKSNITALAADDDGRSWVLRRPPVGKLLASAHDVAREHRVLSALAGTAVPAPRPLAMCTDTEVCEAPLLVMTHVEGTVVEDLATAEALHPDVRAAVGASMASALAAIHAVDLERTGLLDLASHRPYAERQLKRWSRQWEASRLRPLDAVEELARRLAAAIPEQSEMTLVHGDFHLLNLLIDPTSGEVRAVLDWELCTLGDPLADLGGLLAYWAQPGDPPGAPFPASTVAGFPSRERLVELYSERTGRDVAFVYFWEVLALWKVAIICEGVRRRALDDPRNAVRRATFDAAAVESLLDRATVLADEIGI
jgi:aminoglycoside phosphotransferase (APT) family kinase protein